MINKYSGLNLSENNTIKLNNLDKKYTYKINITHVL